jgi:hypothetical protein
MKNQVAIESGIITRLLAAGRNRTDIGRKVIEDLGFSLNLWNGAPNDDRAASLSFLCGAYSEYVSNTANLSLSTFRSSAALVPNFDLLRNALLILIKHFAPDSGIVSSHAIPVESPYTPPPGPDAGWLTYVADKEIPQLDVRGYETERVGDAGTLIIATREQFTAANQAHLDRVATLQEMLTRRFLASQNHEGIG